MINTQVITQGFEEYQRALNMAQTTIDWEGVLLGWFFEFLREEGVENLADVNTRIMLAYQILLSQKLNKRGHPYNARTQNLALSTARKLFKYLMRRGDISADPTSCMELARTTRSLPRNVLSAEELVALLSAPTSKRNRAMLEVLYSTGMRSAEIRNLDMNDLNADDGTIFIRDGKGGKDRVVPCGERAWRYLALYIQDQRYWMIATADEQSVFVNKYGGRFAKQGLLMLVKRHCVKARMRKIITPHGMRHAFATHLADNGCDIRVIQDMMGHASPCTTAIYIAVSARRLKDAHKRCHPLEKDSAGTDEAA
jgi:integrase/recombinase XerD